MNEEQGRAGGVPVGKRIFEALGGLIVIAVGYYCMIECAVRPYLHSRASRGWSKVSGRIVAHGVRTVETPSSYGTETGFVVYARYTYEVAGTRYHGDRINFGGAPVHSRFEAARSTLKRFAKPRVEVYVNPACPGESVLEPWTFPWRACTFNFVLGLMLVVWVIRETWSPGSRVEAEDPEEPGAVQVAWP